jgi:ribosomal protein L40E
MSKLCPVCGGESPDNANFCVKCGMRHEEIKQEEKTELLEAAPAAEITFTEPPIRLEAVPEIEYSVDYAVTTADEPAAEPPAENELNSDLSEEVYPESIHVSHAEIDALAEPLVQTEQQNKGEEESAPDKENSLDELFTDHDFDDETPPPKGSRYAPISSMGIALSIIAMNIPVIGFILTIIWASGGSKKITRRNLARAQLILILIGIILAFVFALLVRFAFADTITKIFENMYPGYTITWG